jgi:hypothetical protein
VSRKVRSRFDALRADGILDRRYRVYRASRVPLYSRFRVASTPDLTTDKPRDDLLTTRGDPPTSEWESTRSGAATRSKLHGTFETTLPNYVSYSKLA